MVVEHFFDELGDLFVVELQFVGELFEQLELLLLALLLLQVEEVGLGQGGDQLLLLQGSSVQVVQLLGGLR